MITTPSFPPKAPDAVITLCYEMSAMPESHEIRADYDANTIVMYQAYGNTIADAALAAGRFVAPFSFQRMTWIKPSFLWLMTRSHWATRSGQERILAVRITREGWQRALTLAVPTDPTCGGYGSDMAWREAFESAKVHVQWDTERSLQGAGLGHYSIQVGISRHLIREFANDWITSVTDLTPRVRKMRELLNARRIDKVTPLLPRERVYPIDPVLRRKLGMP
jgi:hypothetical protein